MVLRVNSPVAQTNVAFGDSCGGIFTPIARTFAQGEVTTTLVVAGQPRLHVVPLAKWNDGSLKHCAIVGVWSAISGDNLLTLQAGAPSANTFAASALPADVVALGGATLMLAQATLHRTWFATPDMIERHYRAKVGVRYVWWYVRQWSNGSTWIGRKVENNRSQDSGVGGRAGIDPFTRINDTVSVGSFQATLAHDPNSGYFVENWISGADPGTTYLHDPLALSRSMLVPNWIRRPNGRDDDNSKAYIFAQSTYAPLKQGTHATDWTVGGYRESLGVLPKWDAVMAKYADARGMAWGKTQGLAINAYSVVIRDPKSHNPPKCTEIGVRDNPDTSVSANGLTWDSNHGVNSGYVPYLLTGDFRFWETMAQHAAALVYFTGNHGANTTQRSLANGEPRGVAWTLRTLAQMVATGPEAMANPDVNAFVAEYRATLAFNVAMWLAAGTQDVRAPGPYTALHPGNELGIPFGGLIDKGQGPRCFAPFMYVGYWTHAIAHLIDIQPLADLSQATALMQWLGRATVGMLGPGGPDAFAWDMVATDPLGNGSYLLCADDDGTASMGKAYATWGAVYRANFGAPRTPGPALQPLGGTSIPVTTVFFSGGNWVLHAISGCVDHGVAGADAAFARLTGAANFADFGGDNSAWSDPTFAENIGYGATPTEGIVPRTWIGGRPPGSAIPVAGSTTPAPSGTLFVPIPGSSPSLIPGLQSYAIDDYSGLATDFETGRIYSVAGGGHAAGDANWVLMCDLTAASPKWVVLKAASGDQQRTRSLAYWPDGRPTGAHNYYACQVVTIGGRKGLLRVVNMYGSYSGFAPLHTDMFWLDTNEWDLNGIGWPTPPIADATDAMVCQDPHTGLIYTGETNGRFRTFDPATKVWSSIPSNGWGMAFGGSVVIPDTNQVVYDYGAFRAPDWARYLGKIWGSFPVGGGAHTEVQLNWKTAKPPIGPDGWSFGQESGLTYDPIGKKIYWISRYSLMRVDPVTWDCQYIADVPQAYTGCYNRFGYIPALNALYYLPRASSDVLLLRNPRAV